MRLFELTESFSSLVPGDHGTNHPDYDNREFSQTNNHAYTIFELSGMYFLVAVSAKGDVTFGTTEVGDHEPSVSDFSDDMKHFTGSPIRAFSEVIGVSLGIIEKYFQTTKTFVVKGKDEKRAKLYQRLLTNPSIVSEMKEKNLEFVTTLKGNIYLQRV